MPTACLLRASSSNAGQLCLGMNSSWLALLCHPVPNTLVPCNSPELKLISCYTICSVVNENVLIQELFLDQVGLGVRLLTCLYQRHGNVYLRQSIMYADVVEN